MRQQSSPMLRPILFLLLANALLGGLIYAELTYPDRFVRRLAIDSDSKPSANVAAAAPGTPAALEMPGEAAFSVIASRPLFSSDRRPAEAPAEAAPAIVSSQPPSLVVTGIVGAGEDSMAILLDLAPRMPQQAGQVVRAGDTVLGWTVESILPEEGKVVLTSGERRHELELVDEEGGAGQRGPRVRRPPVPRTVQPNTGAAQPRTQIPAQPPATR